MVRLLKRLKGKDEELTEDQEDNVKKYEDYLTSHKVPELFNKLLTNIIHDRPDDVKKHLIDQLEKILYFRKNPSMQETCYFTSEDFELMFESYDVVGEGFVDFACLVQALQVAGVKNPEELLAKDFPQVRTSSHISKPQFALILNQGFQKAGYC